MLENTKRFTELLNAYLAGKASSKMHMELMRLIKTGGFDELLKAKIEEELYLYDGSASIKENTTQKLLSGMHDEEAQLTFPLHGNKKTINQWWKWAAAASVIISVAILSWVLAVKKKDQDQLAQNAGNKLSVAGKTEKYIKLPDGSTVLLNEGSELDYPESFDNNTREVTLTGEGYFDIRTDAGKPFIVHTGKVNTTVLGTAFNIKAYPEQKQITVTVTRGKVKVSDDKKTLGVITPDESISISTITKKFRQDKVKADDVVLWKKQYLVLDDISLGEAAVLIDAKYHTRISFSKEDLKNCRISATFLDNENLEQVLKVVTGVVNAHYSSHPNDQVIISGEGCK